MQANSTLTPPRIRISQRLHAWWHGYNIEPRRHRTGTASDETSDSAVACALDRPALLEAIWGQGFSSPGDPEFLKQQVKPLRLNPSSNVVEVGCGLGGAARFLVQHYGCWVIGLESDGELAAAGQARSEAAGMAKRAEIRHFRPTEDKLKAAMADCVMLSGVLSRTRDKQALVVLLRSALKDRGQLMITDFVLKPGVKMKDLVPRPPNEPRASQFWSAQAHAALLEKQKFVLDAECDTTERHCRAIESAWGAFARGKIVGALEESTALQVLAEAESWHWRLQAVEQGLLEVRCFNASKKFSAARTLSDW